jgi:hypothetical protein
MELVFARRILVNLPAAGMVALMALLALVNVAAPAAADTLVAAASSCSIDSVRGGLNVIGIIDASCSLTGLGAVFMTANPYAGAFCAGWGVGRLIDRYYSGWW